MQKYCAYCEKPFEAKGENQKFCSRGCFKLNYIRSLKAEKPPFFLCPNCGENTELKFNPKKDKGLWENFICPICKFKPTD